MRFEAKCLKVALSYGAYMTRMFSGEATVYRARHEGSESRGKQLSTEPDGKAVSPGSVVRVPVTSDEKNKDRAPRILPLEPFLWLAIDLVILTQ